MQVLTAKSVTNNTKSLLHTFNTHTLSPPCKYFIFAGHKVCVLHVSHRVMEMSPSYRWHDTMKTLSGRPRSDDPWTWVVAAGSKACLSLGLYVLSHMGAGAPIEHRRCLVSGVEGEYASWQRSPATLLKGSMLRGQHRVEAAVLFLTWERWEAKLDRRMNLRYHVTGAGRQRFLAVGSGFFWRH